MPDPKIPESLIKHAWHTYLTTGNMPASLRAPWFEHKSFRPVLKMLPHSPRCRICYIPFQGVGGFLTKTFLRVEASKLNPYMCNLCESFATEYHGGAEIEISIMFVDVRGSTTMAEKLSPAEFSRQINLFYRAATEVFYRNNGWVEKLLGDEVAGFFVPGFAGPDFPRVAVEAGRQILKAMGYGNSSKPWMPVGVGIHTGVAYVGSVEADGGVSNIAILGDSVNTAARLTSLAAPGELIVSDATMRAAGLRTDGLESRNLKLKGKSESVDVWVLRLGT
jgi:adenylate cyclase